MKKLDQANIKAKGPDQDGHLIVKLIFGEAAFIPRHEAVKLAKWILETYEEPS